MIGLQTIAVAFAMFSALPVPQFAWNQKNMRYAMCAFPLIGVVIGGLWCLCGALPLPMPAKAAGFCLIPVWVTGGIHLDGYADTCDALSSYGDREKKLEILKDPHCGAFAVIRLCSYFAAYLALCACVDFTPRVGLCWTLALVLERVRASIMLCSIRLSIRSCTQNVNNFCKFCAFLHLYQISNAGFMHPTQKSTPPPVCGGGGGGGRGGRGQLCGMEHPQRHAQAGAFCLHKGLVPVGALSAQTVVHMAGRERIAKPRLQLPQQEQQRHAVRPAGNCRRQMQRCAGLQKPLPGAEIRHPGKNHGIHQRLKSTSIKRVWAPSQPSGTVLVSPWRFFATMHSAVSASTSAPSGFWLA